MNRARSLTVQLIIFTILPLTVALAAIAIAGLSLHQRAMRDMVAERDERATRAAAAAMEEQLQQRAATVRSLALHATHAAPAVALADTAAVAPQFLALALFAPDGSTLAEEGSADFAALNACRAAEAEAGQSGVTFCLTNSPTGAPLLIVTAPAHDGGLAAGAFDPAVLARSALSRVVLPGDHTLAYVVAPDGTAIYQVGHSRSSHSGPITEHPGVAEALRGEIGTTFLDVGSDEHVITHTPVNPVGWALVMEEPWREMTDPMLRRTELAPFVLLPVLAVALAALWFGARQVVRPLQELSARTTALGRGDFDAVREPVGGIAEIRVLQGELAAMARRLRQAQQGLRDYLGALTAGQEEERHRLARELHDDTIQSLIALNQRIQLARAAATDEAAAGQLAEMERLATDTIDDLRRLTRDLRPSYLDDLGLAPALRLLARDQTAALGIPVGFVATGQERRLAPATELAFYRIAQEALRNVGRHARADAATVALDFAPGRTTLTVSDDGVGFDATERAAERALGGHFGLLGASERAEAVGARLAVESAVGKGTAVRVTSDG